MRLTYVIEHMEEDEATPSSLPPWVELEYSHMLMLAGPSSQVLFTHLSRKSSASLRGKLAAIPGPVASSEAYTQSILDLLKERNVPLSKVCLLDPKAERKLEPEDGAEFGWFLFGARHSWISFPRRLANVDSGNPRYLTPSSAYHDLVLTDKSGDDPPRDRTAQLRQLGFPTRHLGPVQMTTDTALGVTKRVVDDQTPLDDIPYVEFPTIRFNAKESVEMPFKYISDRPGGEPLLPPGMRELLHEDLNKSFDF